MSVVGKVKERLLARLEELISEGGSIPDVHFRQVVLVRAMGGETKYRDCRAPRWAEFVEWRTSCVAVLDQVVPESSLLRKAVVEIGTMKNETEKLVFGVAFLKGIKTEIEKGSLESLAAQIESELLADYLTQAEAILGESRGELTHVAAAVLAGASLERSLRGIGSRLIPLEPLYTPSGAPLAMNALIEALKSRGSFNEVEAKLLRAWAGIRNSAAHGKFEEFNRSQVEQMLQGVLSFVARHGG